MSDNKPTRPSSPPQPSRPQSPTPPRPSPVREAPRPLSAPDKGVGRPPAKS